MRNFNHDDFNDEFNDDFNSRWEEFNNRMKNDRQFRRDINKFQKDFEDLMRLMSSKTTLFGEPINFNFAPLTEEDLNKMFIPEDKIDSESGTDENGDWETKNWTSPDGKSSYSFYSRSSKPSEDGFDDMSEIFKKSQILRQRMGKKKEETKEAKLIRLQKALDHSVSQENYEKAAELKKEIDELKKEEK